jgi:hypothetical protein
MTRLITLFLALSSYGWAALPATGVIEIRASATAGNVNGCGFNSARGGTDYTLQNAAQLTNTDGAASGGTTFTSSGSTFTSQMVGNYLHITVGGGMTVGWYEIVTFTDATNVVLDRTPGTGSSATFYVGGACSLGSTLDDDLFEIGIPGNRFNIKNGSYTLGEAVSIGAAGSNLLPITIEGYNSTSGDKPTGSTRPVISGGANTILFAAYWRLGHVVWTATAASTMTLGSDNEVYYSKIINTSTTASRVAVSTGADSNMVSVEAISYRGAAVSGNSRISMLGCYIHDSNIGWAGTGSAAGGAIVNTIFADNVAAAIRFSAASSTTTNIINSTLYGAENKLGVGFDITTTGAVNFVLVGSIIYGFTTGVAHVDSTQLQSFDNWNAYNNNTTDVSGWTKGPNDVTTAPQFTSVSQLTGATATTSGSVLTQSGANFSTVTDNVDFVYLVSGTGITAGKYLITSHTTDTLTLDIAPGTNATADKVWQVTTGHNFAIGTNYKALGFPGVFAGALSTGYIDIGAVQRQEPAGGSGGAFGYVK